RQSTHSTTCTTVRGAEQQRVDTDSDRGEGRVRAVEAEFDIDSADRRLGRQCDLETLTSAREDADGRVRRRDCDIRLDVDRLKRKWSGCTCELGDSACDGGRQNASDSR